MIKLDHRKSYEWIGSFWLPYKPECKYAGKLTYSPEHGISVSLLNLEVNKFCNKSRLIIYGVITNDQETVPVTLLETFFYSSLVIIYLLYYLNQ